MRPSLDLRARLSDDRGAALIVVIAMTGILSLIVTVSFTVARRSIGVASLEVDTQGALAAADAGIDDYMFRLNNIDEYWQYSAANPPPEENLALSPATCLTELADADTIADLPSCSFRDIPGGEGEGQFAYYPDTARLADEGVIELTSIGVVGDRYRAVEVSMKLQSFLDFLYFTNFETLDPIAYGSAASIAWAEANCSVRRWESERPGGCVEIYWALADSVNGPFHTNDRWRINGNPTWEGDTSGSAPDGVLYTGSGSPSFNGGPPFYQQPLEMPPSNAQIRSFADYENGGEGCLFTGPTEIELRSDGRLEVESPFTLESGPGCGSWSGSGGDARQTIDLPDNGVIYVQAIPADPSDPNYTVGCPYGYGGNGIGYPRANDTGPQSNYSCRDGDAFVEGTLSGRLTIASEQDIVITWNLLYDDPTTDMLGLVANEFVQVYHPVQTGCGGNRSCERLTALPNHDAYFSDVQINAAILAINHSFMVQNWAYGLPLGDLYVNGAIAQIYRGPVGRFSGGSPYNGYEKDYNYDERMQYSNPPHFINPVLASWRVARYAEQY